MKKLSYQNSIPENLSEKMFAYLDAKFNLYWDEDENGCWIWNANKNYAYYGLFYLNDYGTILAHRYSAIRFVTGQTDKLNVVMHSCDNRRCVNPKHLSWGTQLQNVKDMMSKGRSGFKRFKGEEHGMARLKDSDIPIILQKIKDGVSCRELARLYKVVPQCIGNIKKGRAWKHIPR